MQPNPDWISKNIMFKQQKQQSNKNTDLQQDNFKE